MAVTKKNSVFWDIKTQFLLHRKHLSATEPSRLVLCKIRCFHGNNEECCLQGYDDDLWLL
jgi:hypothetical protein